MSELQQPTAPSARGTPKPSATASSPSNPRTNSSDGSGGGGGHSRAGPNTSLTSPPAPDDINAAQGSKTNDSGGETSPALDTAKAIHSYIVAREARSTGCCDVLTPEGEEAAPPDTKELSSDFFPGILGDDAADKDDDTASEGSPPSAHVHYRAARSNSSSEGSLSTSASSGSTEAAGTSTVNPRRSRNPVFAISPRQESDGDVAEQSTPPHVVRLRVTAGPPTSVTFDLACLEERKSFVTQQCVALAARMSSEHIIADLLPALLTAFECDDYSESFDDCTPSIARLLPEVVRHIDDRSTQRMTCFLGLLMELSCSAEVAVLRETTIATQKILQLLDDDVVIACFLPLVLSMRVCFWAGPRVVAAGLLGALASRPAVVDASGMTVTDWFNSFIESSRDPCVLVRAAAVQSLQQWVRVARVHSIRYVELPFPLVAEFMTDDLSDTMRYLLVSEVVAMAPTIGKEVTSKYLLSTFTAACVDSSWRVRYVAATHLGAFAHAVLKPDMLLRVITALARDEEPAIRSAVAHGLAGVVECLSLDGAQQCVPVVMQLGEDSDALVRSSAITSYAAFILLENGLIAKSICNGVLRRMQDSAYTVQVAAIRSLRTIVAALEESERRLSAQTASSLSSSAAPATIKVGSSHPPPPGIAKERTLVSPTHHEAGGGGAATADGEASLSTPPPHTPSTPPGKGTRPLRQHRVDPSADVDTTAASTAVVHKRTASIISALVSHLQLLSDAGNWRLRNAVVHVLRYFCTIMAAADFRPLTQIIYTLLHDPVSVVRAEAVETLSAVATTYGPEWAAQSVVDFLNAEVAQMESRSYVWRMMCIHRLGVLLPVVSGLNPMDLRRQHLLIITTDLMRQHAADAVPNVRLAVAQAMTRWSSWFATSPAARKAFASCAELLRSDSDADVARAAAHLAHNKCDDTQHADAADGGESLQASSEPF